MQALLIDAAIWAAFATVPLITLYHVIDACRRDVWRQPD